MRVVELGVRIFAFLWELLELLFLLLARVLRDPSLSSSSASLSRVLDLTPSESYLTSSRISCGDPCSKSSRCDSGCSTVGTGSCMHRVAMSRVCPEEYFSSLSSGR